MVTGSHAVDALERPVGTGEGIETGPTVGPSGLHSVRLEIDRRAAPPRIPEHHFLQLPATAGGFSRNGEPGGAGFDGAGSCLPLELVPAKLDGPPAAFDLAHLFSGGAQVVVPDGQAIELLPDFAELWLLAAAIDRDRDTEIAVGDATIPLHFPAWRDVFVRESRHCGWPRRRIAPERFRRVPVALSTGHLHDRRGRDLAVERGSLFAIRVPIRSAPGLVLPRCRELRLVAATLLRSPARPVSEGGPLF
jgi:hypothetical protein